MKNIITKLLPLSLLLLAGCWDSGCCKKNKCCTPTQQATPAPTAQKPCGHGCTHDHSKDHSNSSQEAATQDQVAEVLDNNIESNEK